MARKFITLVFFDMGERLHLREGTTSEDILESIRRTVKLRDTNFQTKDTTNTNIMLDYEEFDADGSYTVVPFEPPSAGQQVVCDKIITIFLNHHPNHQSNHHHHHHDHHHHHHGLQHIKTFAPSIATTIATCITMDSSKKQKFISIKNCASNLVNSSYNSSSKRTSTNSCWSRSSQSADHQLDQR
eukprot:2251212-Amphidinium_carterae.1